MIYICVPTHDEERTIGLLLWKVRRVMADFERDYEIVVFDDASTDETPEVLERYAPMLPLRVLRSDQRIGFGAAVERLLRDVVERSDYPKRDVAVTLQGDLTEDPADLVDMVKAIEGGADLVAGAVSEENDALPFKVRLLRRLASWILGPAHSDAPVADPLSGFRAYRLIVLKKAFREAGEGGPLLGQDGWAANFELLVRAAPHTRRLAESPYRLRLEHRPRSSRVRPVHDLKALLPLRRTSWA